MKKQILILAAVLAVLLSPFGGVGGGLFAQALPGAGNCLEYNGTSDYVDVGNSNMFNFGDGATDSPFTFSAWIKRTANGGTIISKYNSFYVPPASPTKQQYAFNITAAGILSIFLFQTVQDYRIGISTNNAISDLNWHHVAATYDGSSNVNGLGLFIDGVLQATTVVYNNPSYVAMKVTTESLKIGKSSQSDGTGYFFPGQIDEVCIWNRALTQTEIRNTMCQKLAGNEAGLVGYWRFDETSGTTAIDSSPNGNNGTLW